MAQHFLLSRPAKTLSLAAVFRLTDLQAEAEFRAIRWAETDGAPVCPDCGGLNAYECRRPNGALRFRCRECRKDFTLTSGTLFASHKLPLRMYLGAIAIFCNEVKGKAALGTHPASTAGQGCRVMSASSRASVPRQAAWARAELGRLAFQFQGSSSSRRLAGWSGRRASTSASQACGSTSLSLAVSISV